MANSDERVGWELIWRSGNIPPRYQSLAEPTPSVVEWAGHLPAGSFILDVGCGVGRHLVYLGKRGFRVAGVDVSPSAIRISQEVCAERQIPFEGHVADMSHLPWDDNTFDGALSISTIHHHLRADVVKTLAEVRRVLKPGGLLVTDFPCTDAYDYQLLRQQVAAGELTEPEPNTFVDVRPNQHEMSDDFLPHHFCDEADARDLLKSFEVEKLEARLRDKQFDGITAKTGKWVVMARKPLSG